jgi:hypothetical protein
MIRNIKLLERVYLFILVTILLLIVFTPYIIRSGFTLVEEEFAEVIAITLMFTAGYIIALLYRKEATRNRETLFRLKRDKDAMENRLSEDFKYIGAVNVEIEAIKSVFSGIRKFPESKKDFHHILQFLAQRILSMVNVEWMLFRIINTQNLNTLSEYSEKRGNTVLPGHKISNRQLTSNEKFDAFTIVRSGQKNIHFKTFCIIPGKKLSRDQEVFLQAIVNQLEMLFIIFTSIYFKNNHLKNGNLSTL